MALDILECASKCIEETGFFNDQEKLDTMYHLMQGLTYQQVARRMGRQISYVHRVMDFLRNNGLLYWGRWTPNVYRIGMKKTIAFLRWEDREIPMQSNSHYETFVHYVQAEKTKVCAIYTYPVEHESKIVGEKGDLITPFYHTYTKFTVPLFKKIDLVKEFFDIFHSVDNDEGILSGTTSFEAKPSYTDPITVYLSRYSEISPELTPAVLTEKLEQDFKDYGDIEIDYDKIREVLNTMKERKVIYPKNMLHLSPLSYQKVLAQIKTKEIYRIMGTFNKFNMLTQLASTKRPEDYYLFIEYPFYQLSEVLEILSRLDTELKAYILTKYIDKDTIYYEWALERFLESKR